MHKVHIYIFFLEGGVRGGGGNIYVGFLYLFTTKYKFHMLKLDFVSVLRRLGHWGNLE